jgi:alkylation response protein AidB-like acyl-CoA dehydrogenase
MTVATEHATDTTAAELERLLARITDIQPLLEKNAAQGEADRRVVEESITALTDAGAFRIAQPRRYGGYGLPVRAMLDVSAAVAEADGGTAWVVALCNICAWMTGLFSRQAQDDVWAANPDAKVSGVLAPTAETTKVDGGYRVTGRWYYNSGSWHADWAVLAVPLTDEHGEVVDHGAALVPRTDVSLEDTWFVAGMRSSGSNCLVAEDVFVPEHRVISVPPAILGQHPADKPDEEDLYRSALVPTLTLVLAGPQLGMGRKALRIVRDKAARKGISYTNYATQAESVAFQLQLAEAAMRIDSAHLHAYRAAEDIDTAAAENSFPDPLLRARVRADTGWAVENITRAVDILLSAHGAASFAEVNPLQRIWRDSSVAARHAIVLPAVNYEVFGKALLGRDDQITPFV